MPKETDVARSMSSAFAQYNPNVLDRFTLKKRAKAPPKVSIHVLTSGKGIQAKIQELAEKKAVLIAAEAEKARKADERVALKAAKEKELEMKRAEKRKEDELKKAAKAEAAAIKAQATAARNALKEKRKREAAAVKGERKRNTPLLKKGKSSSNGFRFPQRSVESGISDDSTEYILVNLSD